MKCIQRCLKLFSGQRLILTFIFVLIIFMSFTLITYYSVSQTVNLKRTPTFTRRSDGSSDGHSQNGRTSRILSYCNHASNINLIDEGNIGEDWESQMTLNKVIVIIRHGDRGPLRYVRDLNRIDCDPWNDVHTTSQEQEENFPIMEKFVSDCKSKLPQLSKLSHSLPYQLFPPNKKCNIGHLTHYGVWQHLTLGSLFDQIYSKRLPIKRVKALTTQYPRTFQSAVAFLYGFLRPSTNMEFKNFPQIRPTKGTFFCSRQEYCSKCLKIDKLNKELSRLKREILDSHPAVESLLAKLRPILAPQGNVTSQFQTPVAVFDSLMSYVCHHNQLPCDENKNCIDSDHIRQVVAYIDYQGKQMMNSETFKHISWLKVIGFFNELVKHMNASANDIMRQSTLTLFSAHDLTLVAVAAAFDFFDGSLPPYASRITLEVYTNNTDQSKYFRILYNGKDVTRLTHICKSTENACLTSSWQGVSHEHEDHHSKYNLISVQSFSEYIIDRFQTITKSNNYSMACKI